MGQNQANYPTTTAARKEPVIIDQDMTPGDIVGVLEHLRFHGATVQSGISWLPHYAGRPSAQ